MFVFRGIKFCAWHAAIIAILVWLGYLTINHHPHAAGVISSTLIGIWRSIPTVILIFLAITTYLIMGTVVARGSRFMECFGEILCLDEGKETHISYFWLWPFVLISEAVSLFCKAIAFIWCEVPAFLVGEKTK